MSKVDDELTRRFHRAERPLDSDGLFEGIDSRRRRRETIRRIEIGFLAIAVLLGTGGGFLALHSVFAQGPRGSAVVSNFPYPNGRIVFSRVGGDGHYHVFVARPDGTDVEQLTHGATDDTDFAISPGGRWITLVRIGSDDSEQVETISFQEPDAPAVEPQFSSTNPEPAWSADGRMIAVREGTALLIVPVVGESHVAHLSAPGEDIAHPSWSPGSRLVFALIGSANARETGWDLGTVSSDGTGFRWLLRTPGDQTAAAWSPDGSRIAFLQQGDHGQEIWTIAPDGTDERLIAKAGGVSLEPDLAWVSDGSALLVSDGDWIYRIDASGRSEPGGNLVQLFEGKSPAWQPLPASSSSASPEPSRSPSPEPTPSPSTTPEGQDIGLGFKLCDLQKLEGIDWYGDGTSGAAWTGARATSDGSCPEPGAGEYVVAADLDGDGVAEPGGMGFLANCFTCRPYASTDLNADGVLELVVLEQASSTPSYSIFEVSLPGSERSPGIYNLNVAPPGYREGGFPGGQPIRFSAGGDEGYSAAIDCEHYPEAPVLVVAWSNYVVEVDSTEDVFVTRLQLGPDGAFHVVGSDHYTQDIRDPLPIDPIGPACGVDWSQRAG